MHDSRKTLLDILFDTLINFFTIATVILFSLLLIYQSILFTIPLALSLCASVITVILDIKHYLLPSKNSQRVNVVINGQEYEKTYSALKVGSEVSLYPGDKINFVGKVKSGVFFVDESSINGSTKLVRKAKGSNIIKGAVVIEGSGFVEVTELDRRFGKIIRVKETSLKKRIKILNFAFSAIVLITFFLTYIFKKDSLDNYTKSAILALPCLINIILTIYFLVKSKKSNKGIEIFDHTFLSELQDVDVVCLDKTGTLTTGNYEVFKTVILSQTSFSTVALDPNRALEQTVSNIIKTTREKGGYYATLQERFIYDVTKVVVDSSPLRSNGLYSAITIKGGVTYALGEVESFELANADSASSIIEEYQSTGYHVLVLVESKNPLKSGLIDGKSTAIGLIILQETIRESAIDLIDYCLKNGKQVKVISGDKLSTVSELCRKAGLENVGKAISTRSIREETLISLLEDDVVFAETTPAQKAFIVRELQKNGHKVAFIGNGDNDTQALKTSNVAISFANGSRAAIKCSHASISDNFALTKSFIDESRAFKGKMDAVSVIAYSQNAFASFYLIAFMIASFINSAIYNPFEYNHLWMWIVFGTILPIIIILVDKGGAFKQKCFFRNFISASVLLILPIGAMYLLQLLQYSGKGYFGLPSDLTDTHELLITSSVVNNLSYLSLIVMSFFIAYSQLSPFNKFRIGLFLCALLLPTVYAILLAFSVDGLSFITQIDTKQINPINYFVMGIATISCSALYLLVLDVIATVKGENPNVKSKSRS